MAMTGKNECNNCDCLELCFKNLNDELLEKVDKNRIIVKYKKGEQICKQGTFASHIVFIKKGLIKIILEGNPKDLILCIEPGGTMLGLQSLSGKNIFPYTAVSYEETEACLIDMNTFREVMAQDVYMANKVVEFLSDISKRCYERLFCISQKQIHGRFADIIICLMDRIYKTNHFEINLSRKDLADITVMSQESLSRVIRDYKNEGIIDINGKNIKVLNIDKLYEISKFG